jgi:hypothetical protein
MAGLTRAKHRKRRSSVGTHYSGLAFIAPRAPPVKAVEAREAFDFAKSFSGTKLCSRLRARRAVLVANV